ncbi:MAG: oligosaccharide flippase family protein [Pseudomonadota bacterium]
MTAESAKSGGVSGGFLRDTARNAAASIILFSARFVAIAVIARVLGVEAFGIVALAILSVDLLILLALAGLPGVISRFLPVTAEAHRPALQALRTRWLVVSLGILAGVAPLVGLFVLDIEGWLVVLFTLWVLASAVQVISLAEFQGSMRFDLVILSLSLGAVVLLIGACAITVFPSLAAAFVILGLAVVAPSLPWFLLRRRDARTEGTGALPPWPEIISYGVNVCIIGALNAIVWNRGELFVVEVRLGETTLGHYGAAVTLTAMVWRLTGLLQGAVTPHLSRKLKAEQGVGTFLGDLTRLTMAIGTTAALGLALMSSEIVALVFGPAYAPSAVILAVMAPGIAMAGAATATTGVQLMSNGRVPRNALILGAVVLLGGAYVLAGLFGAEGAAAARAITMCGVAAAMPLWLIWRGLGPVGREILGEVAGAVLLVALGSCVVLFAGLDAGWRLLIWALCSYAVVVRATGAFTPVGMVRRTLGTLRAL